MQSKSNKKADKKFSFGYKRLSLLGALINGVILVGGSIYIIYEGIIRITHPEPSHAEGMMYFAFLGVAVNGYAAWKVSTGKSMNEKVLSWHMLEDMLGWVAILIVSIVMQFTDNMYLDPILSLVITSYILFNVFRRLYETLYLFLQGNPSEIDVVKLESDILETENVLSLHHLHSWSLDGEHHVFSVHVVIENVVSLEQLRAVQKSLDELIEDYPFDHHAIQIELEGDNCDLRDTEHSH